MFTTQTTNKGGAPFGNRNAAHSKPLTDELRKILAADGYETLHKGLQAVYQLAGRGDIKALEFIFDRLDGRPRQAVEVSADIRPTIQVVHRPQITREEWLAIYAPKVIVGHAHTVAAEGHKDDRT